MRYSDFQLVSSEKQPGFAIAPVTVDVMFEILSLNERELQDRLNLADSKWLRIRYPGYPNRPLFEHLYWVCPYLIPLDLPCS